MIHLQAPDGAKDLILRGWKGPRGLKGFVQGRITTPSGDKQFWDGSLTGLVVAVDYAFVSGAAASHGGGARTVTTTAATATASGGSPPYSYAWTELSDDGLGGFWEALSPAAASSTFRASVVAADTSSDALFRCTVTDARGSTGTVDVTAEATVYSV